MVTLWPQQSESITLNETFHKFNRVGDSFTLKITDIKPAPRTLPDKFDWYKGSSVPEQGTQKGVCTINGVEDVLNTSTGITLNKSSVTITGDNATARQGICPNGWHLPTRNEWIDVSRVYIGSEGYYYQLYAVDMMTTTGWYTEKGKDKVGFAVLPAGYAAGSSKFYKVGEEACFWCATPDNAFQSDYVRLNTSDSYPKYEVFSKDRAMSVRCVKN